MDSLYGREEIPEPIMVTLDDPTRRVEGLEAQAAHLPEVRQWVEDLGSAVGSMRQYDADTEIRLRAVCRILLRLDNPERTGFASLADDIACGISLEEARKILERAPLRLLASKPAQAIRVSHPASPVPRFVRWDSICPFWPFGKLENGWGDGGALNSTFLKNSRSY